MSKALTTRLAIVALTAAGFALLTPGSRPPAIHVGKTLPDPVRPMDAIAEFDDGFFATKPWMREFRYVIVVNKSDAGHDAQTIKLYENGALIRREKVSTGSDAFIRKGEHYATKDSWQITPTGCYTPTFLNKDHRSSVYGGPFSWFVGGTKMSFAIFFTGGIALHQAPPGTEPMLGRKASGGCIRLPETLASDLFFRVQETEGARNPRFHPDGSPLLDEDGHHVYSTEPGYSALIIVLDQAIN